MTIKGRLLSSIAIVTRFQTEWQAPLPSGISQPYVVLENHGGGATRPRKSLMISLSRSIQYRRVTDRQPRDDSNSRAYA